MSINTLREIMESEDSKGEAMNIVDIKLRCLEAMSKTGSSCSSEMLLDDAKLLYDWVMDETGFEKQT